MLLLDHEKVLDAYRLRMFWCVPLSLDILIVEKFLDTIRVMDLLL